MNWFKHIYSLLIFIYIHTMHNRTQQQTYERKREACIVPLLDLNRSGQIYAVSIRNTKIGLCSLSYPGSSERGSNLQRVFLIFVNFISFFFLKITNEKEIILTKWWFERTPPPRTPSGSATEVHGELLLSYCNC